MLRQLLTITRNTYLESIRQPIFVVLLLVAALLLLLSPSLAGYSMEDDNKLMMDMSLSTIFLAGLFLAAFTATGVLSAELENRTVLTVISKPVPRPVFVAGKYLGVAAALLLGLAILSLDFLLTVRHGVMQTAADPFDLPVIVLGLTAWLGALGLAAFGNYYYRWVFTSSFVTALAPLLLAAVLLVLFIRHDGQFQSPLHEFGPEGRFAGGQILIVLLLIFEAVLVLSAIAVAASTRLGQILTLAVCSGVFVLGLVSQKALGAAMARVAWADVDGLGGFFSWLLPRAAYRVLPNLEFFWLSDPLQQGDPIPAAYVGWVSLYALAQIAAAVCLAVALFQRREVG